MCVCVVSVCVCEDGMKVGRKEDGRKRGMEKGNLPRHKGYQGRKEIEESYQGRKEGRIWREGYR